MNGGIINSNTRLRLVGYFYWVRIDYGRSPHAYVNQRLQIQLELLMMSGMPLQTCWAVNERWINKFYYKVASCWLFLLSVCCYWSYNSPVQLQFWFLRDQSNFKEKLVSVIRFISKCYSILDLFFYWVIVVHSGCQISVHFTTDASLRCFFVSFIEHSSWIQRSENRQVLFPRPVFT